MSFHHNFTLDGIRRLFLGCDGSFLSFSYARVWISEREPYFFRIRDRKNRKGCFAKDGRVPSSLSVPTVGFLSPSTPSGFDPRVRVESTQSERVRERHIQRQTLRERVTDRLRERESHSERETVEEREGQREREKGTMDPNGRDPRERQWNGEAIRRKEWD